MILPPSFSFLKEMLFLCWVLQFQGLVQILLVWTCTITTGIQKLCCLVSIVRPLKWSISKSNVSDVNNNQPVQKPHVDKLRTYNTVIYSAYWHKLDSALWKRFFWLQAPTPTFNESFPQRSKVLLLRIYHCNHNFKLNISKHLYAVPKINFSFQLSKVFRSLLWWHDVFLNFLSPHSQGG